MVIAEKICFGQVSEFYQKIVKNLRDSLKEMERHKQKVVNVFVSVNNCRKYTRVCVGKRKRAII